MKKHRGLGDHPPGSFLRFADSAVPYPCPSRPAAARTRRGAANHIAVADRTLQPMASEDALT